jgi:Zn-dependent M28 family amino/carboxypeptidase
MTPLLALTALLAAEPFSGASAFRFAEKAVALGARPSGSAEIRKLQTYISTQLRFFGCEVLEVDFTAQTPSGPTPMKNILCRLKGATPDARMLVVSGHYDTKRIPGILFVGANDAGSSTGFLLELARTQAKLPRKRELWIAFFDGEEAVGQWSAADSLYGSRHQAAQWAISGHLGRIDALINIDMIGDKDLNLFQDLNSSPALVRLVWQVARDLGYRKHFEDSQTAIEDDHMPFRRRGVEAIDLIDFEYGPLNRYWHTDKDTMDKLSPASFEIMGQVVAETLRRLDK